MQHLIETILISNILPESEQATARFMEDDKRDYHVFAWTKDDSVLQFGYGQGDNYLNYRPNGYGADELSIHFPYTELTEREAYILFCYEKLKFKKFGYTDIKHIGFVENSSM